MIYGIISVAALLVGLLFGYIISKNSNFIIMSKNIST